MSETTELSKLAAATKPCKICGEEIKAVASKCIHCNSSQDWSAHVNVSTPVFSLLVVLVSVSTTFFSVTRDAFTQKNSSLFFSFQGATKDILSVLVSNQGTRPGSVRYYGRISSGDVPMIAIDLGGTKTDAAQIIDPTSSAMLEYTSKALKGGHWDPSSLANKQCLIELQSTDFLGKAEHPQLSVDCNQIKIFMNASIQSIKPSVPDNSSPSP
jgi:hypothetical protein